MSYSVGELAKLAGISVRTLHHYDEIGLLSPSERTAAGYRMYSNIDVERLQRILVYRARKKDRNQSESGRDAGSVRLVRPC